jgi:dTDP-4-amino-4,6-dideoxygalactose transaminase
VVTTALGFPTTISPIYQNGKIPIFIDVDMDLQPSISQLKEVLEKYGNEVCGAIFTHMLGFPFDEEMIKDMLLPHQWFIVDSCFAKGTKIKTIDGDKNIENIKIGDLVLTRWGYKKVIESKMTGIKEVITKLGITATPDHPFITKNGIKTLDTLSASDTIYVWNQKQSFIEEKSITDIQTPHKGIGESTFGLMGSFLHLFIGKYGLTILGKSLMGWLSIILMEMLSIMRYPIWNFCLNRNMQSCTGCNQDQNELERCLKIWNWLERKLQSGIDRILEESIIEKFHWMCGLINQHIQKYAWFVEMNIKPIFHPVPCIAPTSVNGKAEVYNLEIEDCHEFFANGILVHNCDSLGAWLIDEKREYYPVGHYGDFVTLSFFPAHHITSVEGGAVLTNDFASADILDSLRSWGRSCKCLPGQTDVCGDRFGNHGPKLPPKWDHKYTFDRLGYNLKMTDLQAAIGYSQLKRIGSFVDGRVINYHYLLNGLRHLGEFYFLQPYSGSWISPFGFPLFLNDGPVEDLIDYLEKNRIRTRRLFGGNLTRQPMLDKYQYVKLDNLLITNLWMEKGFWIGCHPALDQRHLDYVIGKIEEYVKR